jgi:hypothetical protein
MRREAEVREARRVGEASDRDDAVAVDGQDQIPYALLLLPSSSRT